MLNGPPGVSFFMEVYIFFYILASTGEKKPWLFDIGDDTTIIRIPIKQPGFNGKYPAVFFFPRLKNELFSFGILAFFGFELPSLKLT